MNMRYAMLTANAYFGEDSHDDLNILIDRLDDESFFEQDHYVDPLTFDLLE